MKIFVYSLCFIMVLLAVGFVRAILDIYAPESDADDGYTIRRGG